MKLVDDESKVKLENYIKNEEARTVQKSNKVDKY
jgi:hypothetical protein